MTIRIGEPLPDLTLTLTGGRQACWNDFLGRPLVLFFYPRANTPGCTQEVQEFRDIYPDFQAAGAELLGASRDTLKVQEGFKTKYALPFPLIADPEEILCQSLDVIKAKKLYGKPVRGIERSTFLIGPDRRLIQVWRKVRVPGHAEAVRTALRAGL
ncbi:Peroxiredoxin Bcp [Gammaproteobacteria bacterium]